MLQQHHQQSDVRRESLTTSSYNATSKNRNAKCTTRVRGERGWSSHTSAEASCRMEAPQSCPGARVRWNVRLLPAAIRSSPATSPQRANYETWSSISCACYRIVPQGVIWLLFLFLALITLSTSTSSTPPSLAMVPAVNPVPRTLTQRTQRSPQSKHIRLPLCSRVTV